MSLDCPWLAVSGAEEDFSIKEYTQAFPALGLLDSQLPSLITLIGGQIKSRYLRQLIDGSPVCLATPYRKVHLWNDPKTRKETMPKIYIDCELHNDRQDAGRCSSVTAPHLNRRARWF